MTDEQRTSRVTKETGGHPAQISVVFFGSGPVAATSLELLAQDFTVEAVITKPKPPHHRGNFPVIDTAQQLNLPVHYVTSKKELSALITPQPFTSRLGIVIDFGIIINQDVIDYFPLGIVNSHFSLLPEWRGADPITFSILSGQKTTGISLMLINDKMDEGELIAQSPYEIVDNITTPQLTSDLIELSNATLKQVLPLYVSGDIQPAPQEAATIAESAEPTYSRKLTKEDGALDWSKPAEQLEREIRAFIEWPKSRTMLAGKEVVVTSATVVDQSGEPGKISTLNKEIIIFCGQNALKIDRLKPAGKNEMSAQAFLAGYGKLL